MRAVFLCHASEDKEVVRELADRLEAAGLDAWLDEREILPGQEWELEIRKAITRCRAVVVVLSADSVDKRGFVQKELRIALDLADEQPEGAIFVIPLRVGEAQVPGRLKKWQYLDYQSPGWFERLEAALRPDRSSFPAPVAEVSHPLVADTRHEIQRPFTGERHDYKLFVDLVNLGSTMIDQWHIDVWFPSSLIEGSDTTLKEVHYSDNDTNYEAGKKRVWPGRRLRVLEIDYFVTHANWPGDPGWPGRPSEAPKVRISVSSVDAPPWEHEISSRDIENF